MSAHDHDREPLPPSWFEENQATIIAGVVILAVLSVGADIVHSIIGDKHVHFEIEAWPGFYALVGFVSYVGLVLAAKQLRKVVARPADYYDDQPPLLAFDPSAATEVHHDEQDLHDELRHEGSNDEELHEEVTP